MTPVELLIGQIMLVLAIITLSIWIATSWAAASLAYHPEHGAPWFMAFRRPSITLGHALSADLTCRRARELGRRSACTGSRLDD